MKNIFFLTLTFLLFFNSCATVKQPFYQKKSDIKKFIEKKYGQADSKKIINGEETWIYDKLPFMKNKRKVVFNEKDEIIFNKKYLSPVGYIYRYLIIPGFIVVLIGLSAFASSGPLG